jgi:GrpB-like predicted nucleotidyltransferase (UPF0157 family)
MDAMVRKVEVVAHDPAWAERFQQAAQEIDDILGDEVVSIHHIGSTAIPGMPAKPIIDILIVVRDIERVDDYDDAMGGAGYEPRGENGIPGRRYFRRVHWEPEELHTHHVHIFQEGNPQVQRHLDFRDYMMAHPHEARAYAEHKIDLASRFPTDIDAYIEGKDAFIKAIDEKAAAWREEQEA